MALYFCNLYQKYKEPRPLVLSPLRHYRRGPRGNHHNADLNPPRCAILALLSHVTRRKEKNFLKYRPKFLFIPLTSVPFLSGPLHHGPKIGFGRRPTTGGVPGMRAVWSEKRLRENIFQRVNKIWSQENSALKATVKLVEEIKFNA